MTKLGALLVAFCSLLPTQVAPTAQAKPDSALPRFEDYPADGVSPKHHRLVLTSADLVYQTRLREAARQAPDFAGHYVLVQWGCGAECIMGAAIDVRSGRVTWLPGGTICCWFSGPQWQARDIDPIRYQLHSRLLVLNGLRHERDGDLGQHFYTMEHGHFVHLLDLPADLGSQ